MTCYNSLSADNYAKEQGELQELDAARDQYCESFYRDKLNEIKDDPTATINDDDVSINVTLWEAFAERQADLKDPLNMQLSAMLADLADLDDSLINHLATVSSTLADTALAIKSDIRDLLLEHAAGEFDSMIEKGSK